VRKNRVTQAAISLILAAGATVGFSATAQAAPAGFTAKAIHSGGSGALADEATGGFSWLSRSVVLTNTRFWVKAGECGRFIVTGMQGDTMVDWYSHPSDLCGGASGAWHTIGNVTLDGSSTPGGITEVIVYAEDIDHTINGYADCYRSNGSCYTGQY
jgi:hypothetical protein